MTDLICVHKDAYKVFNLQVIADYISEFHHTKRKDLTLFLVKFEVSTKHEFPTSLYQRFLCSICRFYNVTISPTAINQHIKKKCMLFLYSQWSGTELRSFCLVGQYWLRYVLRCLVNHEIQDVDCCYISFYLYKMLTT